MGFNPAVLPKIQLKHNVDKEGSTRLFAWSQRMALGAANTKFRMPKITCPDTLYGKSGHSQYYNSCLGSQIPKSVKL